jgi:ATP-dependent DNA helicase RecG
VSRLKGVGPKTGAKLAAAGVTRVVDLILHLPHRYEDRSQVVSLRRPLAADRWVMVRGTVRSVRIWRAARRRMRIVAGVVEDGEGSIGVVWFNQPWVKRRLAQTGVVSLYGPVRRGRGEVLQLVNPDITDVEQDDDQQIVPVYSSLAGIGGKRLRGLIKQCLGALEGCSDPLPDVLRRRFALPELRECLRELHAPVPPGEETDRVRYAAGLNSHRAAAHRRLAFDELLAFACGMEEWRSQREGLTSPVCHIDTESRHAMRSILPFELTEAQQRTVEEIVLDLERPIPMARLIQGDVGSGKTAVAALAILMMVEAGHQAALMAPTELLAEQHVRTLQPMFSRVGCDVDLLTSSLPAAEHRRVRRGLEDRSISLVVGTHALFQEAVRFSDLGLVVVDEQHRFGVVHRQALVEKGVAPNVLVMTATPIPRTLALTVYGDLDVSLIDQLPPGRRPVTTVVRSPRDTSRLYNFLRSELAEGGRAYLVYPMIDGNDDLEVPALENRRGVVEAELPGVNIGVLHGRLSRAEREEMSRGFARGDLQALLATTVVEVGIDVPEASVIVIEGPERFGLSQLHQLRGRVGRGNRRAWCVLLADDSIGEDARRRLDVLCETSDGFEVAEADLALRGPGELTGTRQWGPGSFRFADLVRDQALVRDARAVAGEWSASSRIDALRDGLARYHPMASALPSG